MTLADSLWSAGFANDIGLVVHRIDLHFSVEGCLAMLVVEGIARVSAADNGGGLRYYSDASSLSHFPNLVEDA